MMFHLKPSRTWTWHVKAYFLGQAWMPDHILFSKVNLKYIQHTYPVGQARYSFHLPFTYNLQILLARGNGASTNVEPFISNLKRSLIQLFQSNNSPIGYGDLVPK